MIVELTKDLKNIKFMTTDSGPGFVQGARRYCNENDIIHFLDCCHGLSNLIKNIVINNARFNDI